MSIPMNTWSTGSWSDKNHWGDTWRISEVKKMKMPKQPSSREISNNDYWEMSRRPDTRSFLSSELTFIGQSIRNPFNGWEKGVVSFYECNSLRTFGKLIEEKLKTERVLMYGGFGREIRGYNGSVSTRYYFQLYSMKVSIIPEYEEI